MTATAETTDQRNAPSWMTGFVRSYNAGEAHAFVLHGDTEGTAFEAVSQRGLLLGALRGRREVVATYSIASGIRIESPDETITVGTGPARMEVTRKQRAMMLIGVDPNAKASGGALGAALGAKGPSDPFEAATSPTQAMALLGKLLRADGKVSVVIEYADALTPAPPMTGKGAMSGDDRRVLVTLLEWARDDRIMVNGNTVFLICRELEELHGDLRAVDSGWRVLRMALPDLSQRREYLTWYLRTRARDKRPIALPDDLPLDELANMTAGLSLRNIEDVLLLAAQEGGITRRLVKEYKDQVITSQYSEVAEMIEPLMGGFDDLGGMEPLKAWARDEVIAPIRDGRVDDTPKGILLVGPPGTGKTFFVRALAREVGFNAVALNAANILGGIVGESERKLARFFAFVKSLAPTLVFLDELDQSDMSRRGNNSGNPVAANLFNAMLQFMSDESNRGRVVMVFASNRPDLLDPALLRFGRMDAIVPVLLPDETERASIARAQARAQRIELTPRQIEIVATRTEDYSAADLGAVVRKIRQYARRDEVTAGRNAAIELHVENALRTIRPQSTQQAAYYTNLAVRACNDIDLLPARYAALLDDRQKLDQMIADAPKPAESTRNAHEW